MLVTQARKEVSADENVHCERKTALRTRMNTGEYLGEWTQWSLRCVVFTRTCSEISQQK